MSPPLEGRHADADPRANSKRRKNSTAIANQGARADLRANSDAIARANQRAILIATRASIASPLAAAALVFLCAIALPPAARADDSPAPPSADLEPLAPPPSGFLSPAAVQGPLGLRTQGVLRELFLDPILLDARPLQGIEFDLRWTGANSWSIPTQIVRFNPIQIAEIWTDEQADSLAARVRVPWSRMFGDTSLKAFGSARPLWARFSTALEWRVTEHWGGWSDPAIGSFHGVIGGFDYDRNLYPANNLRLELRDLYGGAVAFNLYSAVFALGDLVARTQFLAFENNRVAIGLRFDLKAPTGRLDLAGSSGGWDGALGVAGTIILTPTLTLHAMSTLSVFSHFSAPIDLQPKLWHGTFDASLEWNLGAVELLAEDRVVTPLLNPGWQRLDFGGDDGLISSAMFASFRAHNQISGGVRWRDLSLWFSEDYTPGSNPRSVITFLYVSNSPDIVIGLSWTRKF